MTPRAGWRIRGGLGVLLLVVLGAVPWSGGATARVVFAQQPPAPAASGPAAPQPRPRQAAALSIDQATILTNGWAFLAQGDAVRAGEKAKQLLSVNPRHPAAFALALEVEILRAGAVAGAESYIRWLGARPADEPAFIRRVSVAILEESIANTTDPSAQLDALSALANGGDIRARAQLSANQRKGSIAEVRMLAAKGEPTAVKQLTDALQTPLPNPVSAIQALGESGSRLAVPILTARLTDARPEVRGAAAEALGKTGGSAVIPRLQALLTDTSSHVRVKAAAALYRLDDDNGAGLLREMAASDSAPVRLAAAEAMASRPDSHWQASVRNLTQAGEPDVRLSAARLAARFDPALASATLQGLSETANPAIRAEASRVMAAEVPLDLAGLRPLLRHPDSLTRVAAAAAVVRLTN